MLDTLVRNGLVHGARWPARLLVAVQAGDPVRVAAFSALVAASGHALAAEDQADLLLSDAPAAGRLPVLVLSDDVPDGISALPALASAATLDIAMRAVAVGLVVRVPTVTDGPCGDAQSPARPLLTRRELEILACLGDGLSNKGVARRLSISLHTVKFHLEAVFGKLGVNSRAEAVAKGLRGGLLEI